jgi:hypothetical protein
MNITLVIISKYNLIFHVSYCTMPLPLDQMGADRRTDGAGSEAGKVEQKGLFRQQIAHAVPKLLRC